MRKDFDFIDGADAEEFHEGRFDILYIADTFGGQPTALNHVRDWKTPKQGSSGTHRWVPLFFHAGNGELVVLLEVEEAFGGHAENFGQLEGHRGLYWPFIGDHADNHGIVHTKNHR